MAQADFLKFYLAFYRIFFYGRKLHDDNKATHAVRVFCHKIFVKFRVNFMCMFTYSKLINHNKIQDESVS